MVLDDSLGQTRTLQGAKRKKDKIRASVSPVFKLNRPNSFLVKTLDFVSVIAQLQFRPNELLI